MQDAHYTYEDAAEVFGCPSHPERVIAALDRHRIMRQADGRLTEDMVKALAQCEASVRLDFDD